MEWAEVKGHSEAEGRRFAVSAQWKLGELEIQVPIIAGWTFTGPRWNRACEAVFVYERRGRYRFYKLDGTLVGPEQSDLAGMVCWALANGWET